MPTDTFVSISFIFDILMLVSCFLIAIAIMFAEKKIQEYIDEVKYLRSCCKQAILVAKQAEEKANEVQQKLKSEKTKSFFQGKMIERKNKK